MKKKIEKYLKNLVEEDRKETLKEMSNNIGVNIHSLKSYIYNNDELRKPYDKCKMRKNGEHRIIEKIEEYMLNLINEGRKETLKEMSSNMNVNINSFATYVSRNRELKNIYKKCKIGRNETGNETLRKLEKVEEYLKNLIEDGKKETLEEMSNNIGVKVYRFKSYVYKQNKLRKLYDKCKMRSRRKNVLDKWESGEFDKIQVNDINLTEEEELKNDIISFLEKNDYITKYDILSKFNITIGKLNALKKRDYDFMKKFNKLSYTKVHVIEERLKNILDNSTKKKTIKEIQNEMDGVSALHIYGFLRKNEKYNEKIFRKGRGKNK